MNADPVVAQAALRLVGGDSLAGQKILVLLPDRTRPFPFDLLLPAFSSALLAAGAEERRIVWAIASGTHAPSPADLEPIRTFLPDSPLVLDPLPEERMASVGTTGRGTEVRVHPMLLEAGIVYSLDAVALHYFAGFGGGGKMLFPGLGARASIAANHRLSLAPERGLAPGVEPGRTHDNPVALDLREAHELLPRARHLSFVPPVAGDNPGFVLWTDYSVFDRACALYADRCRAGTRQGADVVMAFTDDAVGIDVVQAHKALFHAALYAKDGADVFLLAECPEGVGSAALARWLAKPDRATLEADARTAYDLNAQTAVSLAAIAERVRVTWISEQPLPELASWGIRVTPEVEGAMRRISAALAAGEAVVRLDHPTRSLPIG